MHHDWSCADAGSATELALDAGTYTLSPGCTIDRVERSDPPDRADYPTASSNGSIPRRIEKHVPRC